MRLMWLTEAWDEYLYWQKQDKKILDRINTLIKETMRQPFLGIGKPEPLKSNLTGWWSRRITREHRLVYKVENNMLIILQCRFHYDDK
ncbi:MAG: Txe/YoeB family addiction module toxin [Verrucomicrobiales bacterium]|nr:Txe/YoeB family addiction module toxin [Verrucomicrobiales bacterium]